MPQDISEEEKQIRPDIAKIYPENHPLIHSSKQISESQKMEDENENHHNEFEQSSIPIDQNYQLLHYIELYNR